MKEYYDRRADEYDETTYFERGELTAEARALAEVIGRVGRRRILDVACGTGALTMHLRGTIVGLDYSSRMLAIAKTRLPTAAFVRADVPPLPFADNSFDLVFTSNFYGHLDEPQRGRFLSEARRVAPELLVVDSPLQPGYPVELWEERRLMDGSRYVIWKRHFSRETLLSEIGGGEVVFESPSFLAILAS